MAQWTYSRNVQLINEICTVGFLNIDFERCFVSLDVVRISSANGRAIPINLHLHPDTLVHFCAQAASLLNEEHAWDWIEMTLIEEIRVRRRDPSLSKRMGGIICVVRHREETHSFAACDLRFERDGG